MNVKSNIPIWAELSVIKSFVVCIATQVGKYKIKLVSFIYCVPQRAPIGTDCLSANQIAKFSAYFSKHSIRDGLKVSKISDIFPFPQTYSIFFFGKIVLHTFTK